MAMLKFNLIQLSRYSDEELTSRPGFGSEQEQEIVFLFYSTVFTPILQLFPMG
jgi:hypothetical protein